MTAQEAVTVRVTVTTAVTVTITVTHLRLVDERHARRDLDARDLLRRDVAQVHQQPADRVLRRRDQNRLALLERLGHDHVAGARTRRGTGGAWSHQGGARV